MCGNCAKLIDNDKDRYTQDALRQWKIQAERQALMDIERPRENPGQGSSAEAAVFPKIECLMPALLDEMRDDLAQHPLSREFVLLKRSWSYWAGGEELVYYFDDHPQLESKVNILENHGLVNNVTRTNVDCFRMTEGFIEYLAR